MIALSEDGGTSFSEPISVTGTFFEDEANHTVPIPDGEDPAGYFDSGSPTLTVDDAGTLFVAWTSRTANITPSPPSGLYLSTSADRGASFEVREVQAGDKANTGMTGTMLRWSPAGGETGSLHLVWEGKEPITRGIGTCCTGARSTAERPGATPPSSTTTTPSCSTVSSTPT
jgi:hypothetical protein